MKDMREALERIAKYPMTRSEEMSIEKAREIARAALSAVPAQEPFAYVIWGIDSSGKHYPKEVKLVADAPDEQWESDSGFLDDRWAGNDLLSISSKAQQPAQELKNSECIGYALLGTGNYLVNHSAKHAELGAELIITIATEAEKLGRKVGDVWDNYQDLLLQPEDMVVRIGFINAVGLDVLEGQLKLLREVHFPDSLHPAQEPVKQERSTLDCIKVTTGNHDKFHELLEAILNAGERVAMPVSFLSIINDAGMKFIKAQP